MGRESFASPSASIANSTRQICWVIASGWRIEKSYRVRESQPGHALALITRRNGKTNPGGSGSTVTCLSVKSSAEAATQLPLQRGTVVASSAQESVHSWLPRFSEKKGNQFPSDSFLIGSQSRTTARAVSMVVASTAFPAELNN